MREMWENQRQINKIVKERIDLNMEEICILMRTVRELGDLVEFMSEEIDILKAKLSQHGIES